jgi:hypothetical protein
MTSHDYATVILDVSSCNHGNHVVQVRYAWQESPCPLHQCAVYGKSSNLPGPPFTFHGSSWYTGFRKKSQIKFWFALLSILLLSFSLERLNSALPDEALVGDPSLSGTETWRSANVLALLFHVDPQKARESFHCYILFSNVLFTAVIVI